MAEDQKLINTGRVMSWLERTDPAYQAALLDRAQETLRTRLRKALLPAFKLQALARFSPSSIIPLASDDQMDRADMAFQALARDPIGPTPEMFVLPQNINVDFAFEGRFERDEEAPDGKIWVKERRARRMNDVFAILYTSGSLTKSHAAAGDKLVEIYAASLGLVDRLEASGDKVQKERPDPHVSAMLKAADAERFLDILRRVPTGRYRKLLRAVVRDQVVGDGSGAEVVKARKNDVWRREFKQRVQGGARWRRVVENAAGLKDDEAQARAMRLACDELVVALLDHNDNYARERAERRRANGASSV